MTEKEITDLTIFLGTNEAFIGKKLKNGKPAKARRVLTEQETMSFVTWFIRCYCKKYGMQEFTLNVNNVPTYKLGIIDDDNKSDEIEVNITKVD